MKKYKIYISASTQDHNIGIGNYGTEEENMFILCDMIVNMLEEYPEFIVNRNEEKYTLQETIVHINMGDYDVVIDNHSNAGHSVAEGTEIFSYDGNQDGYVLANALYNYISEVSPGIDRGMKNGNHLGFVRRTNFTAVLIEHFFHTNSKEVQHFIQHVKDYAMAEVKGICDYFGVEYKDYRTSKRSKDECIDLIVKKCDEIKLIMSEIEVLDEI